MKMWVALGWIATAAFTGSAYVVVRCEPAEDAWLPIVLDVVTVATFWVCLFLARNHWGDMH